MTDDANDPPHDDPSSFFGEDMTLENDGRTLLRYVRFTIPGVTRHPIDPTGDEPCAKNSV